MAYARLSWAGPRCGHPSPGSRSGSAVPSSRRRGRRPGACHAPLQVNAAVLPLPPLRYGGAGGSGPGVRGLFRRYRTTVCTIGLAHPSQSVQGTTVCSLMKSQSIDSPNPGPCGIGTNPSESTGRSGRSARASRRRGRRGGGAGRARSTRRASPSRPGPGGWPRRRRGSRRGGGRPRRGGRSSSPG